ncbi:serine/threonine protein kinase [Nocardioides sp. NPDC059952]|uniref:serine/threonine protein kinase n=1 Tax=Nocardioides sp. NPDC059952 TaxID=3347014 RepID=UPI00364CDF21
MVAFPQEGEQFGRYVIERVLGQGGMGVVYQAKDPALRRKVALKLVLPSLTVDKDFITRFEREANILAKLRSRNIVQIIEYGEVEGTVYLVTEYVPDGDLHGWLKTKGALETVQALRLVGDVSDALFDAHRAGVVHRDVKPSNVLLWERQEGELVPYLTDFGIATEGDSNVTRAGSVVGSLPYMSPERHMGEQATAAGDIYAAGCLLWACLTGKAPYTGTDFELMSAHINNPVPRLPASTPGADLINPIIQRALAKKPENRFRTAAELAKALDKAADRLEESGLGGGVIGGVAGATAADLGSRPGASYDTTSSGTSGGGTPVPEAEAQPTIVKRPGEGTPPPAPLANETDSTVVHSGKGLPQVAAAAAGSGDTGGGQPEWLPSHHSTAGQGDSGDKKKLYTIVGGGVAAVLLVGVGIFTQGFGIFGLHGDDAKAAEAIASGVPKPGWASEDQMTCAAESLVGKVPAGDLRSHGVVDAGDDWTYTGDWPADDAMKFTQGLLDCTESWSTEIGDNWKVGDTRCMEKEVDKTSMAGLLAVSDLLKDGDTGAAGPASEKAVKALDECYVKADALGAKVTPKAAYMQVDFDVQDPTAPGGQSVIAIAKKGSGSFEELKGSSYELPVTEGGVQGCIAVKTTVSFAWGTEKATDAESCGNAEAKKLTWEKLDKCTDKVFTKQKIACNTWQLNFEGFEAGKTFNVKLTRNGGKCSDAKGAKCVYPGTAAGDGMGAVVQWSGPQDWTDKFVATAPGASAQIDN